MPWHRSKSNPLKVYDSRHEMVCICQSVEEATHMVEAANRDRPVPIPAPRATDIVDHDECCSSRLIRLLRGGTVEDSWVCPRCGCAWLATMDTDSGIRRWSPEVTIEVWR